MKVAAAPTGSTDDSLILSSADVQVIRHCHQTMQKMGVASALVLILPCDSAVKEMVCANLEMLKAHEDLSSMLEAHGVPRPSHG